MKLKFWGGGFLILLFLGIVTMMGCEKGALGVRMGVVTGRVVDADQTSLPVVGARVEMYSEKEISAGGGVGNSQDLITVTNSSGYFTFENLVPDTFLFAITAPGYNYLKVPDASTSTNISYHLGNGETLNVGTLCLKKISNPLTSDTVTVKGKILDAKSKDELDSNKLLTIYFDGRKYENRDVTYAEFKTGLSVTSKIGTYEITIITENYETYKDATSVSGETDNVLNIVMTPICYDVRVTFRNKPFYVNDDVIELGTGGTFAQTTRDKGFLTISSAIAQPGKPYKVLATSSVSFKPYEPEATLTGISLPASLTVLISGYQEMVFAVPYTADTQGMIAMGLDMSATTPVYGEAKSFSEHIVTRPVVVTVHPKTEADASQTYILMTDDQVRVRALDKQWGQQALNTMDAESTTPTIRPLPCGYILPFEVYAILSAMGNGAVHTTNFYYIDPVRVDSSLSGASNATFTANLNISRSSYLTKP